MPAAPLEGPRPEPGRVVRPVELAALGAVLVVAAVARLIDLPGRGMWDADQGHDLLVLLGWVRDGTVPLLGPPTSIGDLHHGAIYYWLLAPAAFATHADPTWVVATIALGGVAMVAVVWWLGRSIGGPNAGLAAAALAATSAAAIEASTFIWNPNLIGLSSAVALAGAWQAWRTARPGWWLVAAGGLAVTMQLHVLGSSLVVPLAGLYVADVLRRPVGRRRGALGAGLGALVVGAVLYLPLIVHEVTSGFPETAAVVEVLAGRAAGEGGPNPIVAFAVIALRSLSWPLAGLLTDGPLVALVVTGFVVASLAWRAVAGDGSERLAARWFGATIAWSVIVLTVVAPSLATVTPGLPNDHYHAFLDPIVFVAAGLGVAALWRAPSSVGRVLAAAASAVLVAWNVATWPPAVADDGGYPAAEAAAVRIIDAVGAEEYLLLGLPDFKPPSALAFPLARAGRPPVEGIGNPRFLAGLTRVVVCDRLFREAIGAECGGPAEDALIGTLSGEDPVVERFDVSSRTSVSIYRPRP